MARVLVCSLGPVQDFIAAARRTRDLWFGSHLLSELSRSAAKHLAEAGWSLVFPALERGSGDLEPCDSMWRDSGAPPMPVSNHIVAIGEGDVDELCEAARAAVIRRWERFATRAAGNAGELLTRDVDLNRAIDQFLEVVAAWAELDGTGYREALREAELALAARKRLRDFSQWHGTAGLPKSTLDGFRETVLARPKDRSARAAAIAKSYRIPADEQLDAIGLVKRLGGQPDQFAPISRIAFEPWLTALPPDTLTEMGKLLRGARAQEIDRRAASWVSRFPFDGELFLPDQRARALSDLPPEERARVAEQLARLIRGRGSPEPYVACLMADGDKVGEALSGIGTPEKHRAFSRALADFAMDARRIAERNGGNLVFSGGDDVLAFLPVAGALQCARELRQGFATYLTAASAGGTPLFASGQAPTLSVGIGIGHVLNPMGSLLELGRRARELAKGATEPQSDRRDALGVVVEKRVGSEAAFRGRWHDDPADRIERVAELLKSGRLPGGLPYEVRGILARLPRAAQAPVWQAILIQEIRRTVAHKEPGAGDSALTPAEIELDLPHGPGFEALKQRAASWVDLCLCAQMFARCGQGAPPVAQEVAS
ncbi:MAG: type III-B CRISPR-associated protein Cas10/Cmr2 [Candidatus Sericytochromatia bacterium]|nr:type III-B CRISPR-associated protein Cas10/Cmr2 [Candidatus Tanganyikabacteria bacterium]